MTDRKNKHARPDRVAARPRRHGSPDDDGEHALARVQRARRHGARARSCARQERSGCDRVARVVGAHARRSCADSYVVAFSRMDMDAFQDQDGCPDADNDGDGNLDMNDRCPNDPEDVDGYEDDDGCPDPGN